MTLTTDQEESCRYNPDANATEPGRAPIRTRPVPIFLISLLTVVGLVGSWAAATSAELVSPVFLPSPAVVAVSLWNLVSVGFVDSTLLEHVLASLGRVLGGLAVSVVIGVPAGLAIGTSRVGRGILDPIVEFLRPLPPLAYLPLIIIWVGIGEASKVTVIALSMLPSIIISTASGVRCVPKDHINAARAFGATKRQVTLHVILPSALPSILTGTKIALGAGWSTLVAAELVAATRGLGFMIQSAAQFLVTDVVIAGIAVIALIAILLEIAARALERWLAPWASAN
ncbi:taurine ABC transporter permease [Sinorhizobium meliloti CCNWSX0020]|uniref:Taurine ABC transporter permease n=2 Tax=Sinorhizobium TaxID=28105 RepID=H0FYU3_RHIML|nr:MULTISPECIES: ABC transporter permease subunit [Sinorhizobium]EHK77826.1 taurine ABC transporter permease [Sinorhizobium meliloti CCNWSX0020]RVE77996.1 ABC transporter permease subunit [Sinorhizobium meliloti]RVG58540.1 ABC transporter permease subunit [Sinorhizobium meliloti]RVH18759.1 ABC transporter permease subunit [Sinorhizobium meliloti]RVH28767.1 ABC transporter permease subunit [Sinorhizobium meliloti]